MSIADTIQSMETNIGNAYDSAQQKGATIPSDKNLANLSSTIDSIQTGSSPTLGTLNATQNGTYYANDDGYDGYDTVNVNVPGGDVPYSRPADWLAIPSMDGTLDEAYILLGVGDCCLNMMSMSITVNNSNAMIDWGDGTIENIVQGTSSLRHEYDPSQISQSTWTSHNDTKQVLIHIYGDRASITALSIVSDFYKIINGVNIPISSIDICDVYHISGNMESCSLKVGKYNASTPEGYPVLSYMEIFEWNGTIISNSIENIKFGDCASLQSISNLTIDNSSTIDSSSGDISYMFYTCRKLKNIPTMSFTSPIVNTGYMFAYCSELKTAPNLDMSQVTNTNRMFFYCSSLVTVPLYNTSNVTNMSEMFYQCSSLESIPQFDTSNVTDMKGLLSGTKISQMPKLNTSNVTNMNNFTTYAYTKKIPLLDTHNITGLTSVFLNVQFHKLKTLPPFNLNNLTSASSIIFNGLYCINKIFPFNFTNLSISYSVIYGTFNELNSSMILYNLGRNATRNTSNVIDIGYTPQPSQWWLDLFNSLATNTTGYTLGIRVGTSTINALSNVYVKPTTDHEVYTLPTNDIVFDSSKTYYTYDDTIEDFVQFTGNDFVPGELYYEDVTSVETKYVLCESTDAGAVLMLDWLTNTKGWTIS